MEPVEYEKTPLHQPNAHHFTLPIVDRFYTMMSVAGQPRCLAARSGIQVRPQPCLVHRAAGATRRRSSPAACPVLFAWRVGRSHVHSSEYRHAVKHAQAAPLSSTSHLRGTALIVTVPRATRAVAQTQVLAQQFEERFRLDNLAPEPGARRKKQRVGRGYGAGQV